MKTINTIKTMKKTLIILILALLFMPLTAMAQQDIFNKYSDNNDVTYASIKPKMFQMLAKMDLDSDDPETKEYMQMVNSITSFKTLLTGNKAIASDMKKWVSSRVSSLEELMEIKDDGVDVNFYIKEGKNEDHVTELLIFVNGLDAMTKDSKMTINGKERTLESVIVSFTGDINLNQLSKLINKFDLPGSKELEKKN